MKSIFDRVRFRVTSSNIPDRIKILTEKRIILYDIYIQDELTAVMTVSAGDYGRALQLLQERGDGIQLLVSSGTEKTIDYLKKRWFFLLSLALILFLTIWIPTGVYFFHISGNDRIPEKRILEALSECGVGFGTKRTQIHSENLKNSVMQKLPELDWAGITTHGCVAVVEVKEKPLSDVSNKNLNSISSIVAKSDGVIDSVTVTKGNPLCKTGQAVQKGQVLISGMEDFGLLLRGTAAEGEVFAKTMHYKTAIAPGISHGKGDIIRSEQNYTLQIGKKLINLKNSSRISTGSCVKMYTRKNLTLPGGFRLPVSLICEKIVFYEPYTVPVSETDYTWINSVMEQYVLQNMTAGEILHKTLSMKKTEDRCTLFGTFACREEIGKRKIEEILNYHGKNN